MNQRLLQTAGLLLLLGGCASSTSRPAIEYRVEAWSKDEFTGRQLSSAHYEIFSTLTDRELESALPGFLESALEQYEATLPSQGRIQSPMRVYVLSCRPEWERFAARYFPEGYDTYATIHAGGFTSGGTSVAFYCDRSTTLATLAHEGWHQYLSALGLRNIPPWLNEGLACYHEAVQWKKERPLFTPLSNTYRINPIRNAVRDGRVLTIRDLAVADVGTMLRLDNSTVTQTYYAQAWALVTFLRHGSGPENAAAFATLMEELNDGRFGARVSAAQLAADGESADADGLFQAYFGRTAAALQDEYHRYLVAISGY